MTSASAQGLVWRQQPSGLHVPVDLDAGVKPAACQTSAAPRQLIDPNPYLISSVPFAIPLIAITMMEDPAILRVLLWQGNLLALFIAILQFFLPLAAGLVAFFMVRRYVPGGRFRIAAFTALGLAAVLMPFTPIAAAIVQSGLLAGTLVVYRVLAFPTSAQFRRARMIFAVTGLTIVTTLVGLILWGLDSSHSSSPILIAPRALYALPREVVVEKDGEVWGYYLVSADDQFTIVIAGEPKAVLSIRSDEIAERIPCRDRKNHFGRSLFSLVVPEAGGTTYCGDLLACLNVIPDPSTRFQQDVVDSCVENATRRR